jgi:hypothetical protein
MGVKYLHGQDKRHHVDIGKFTSDSSIQCCRYPFEEKTPGCVHSKIKKEPNCSLIMRRTYSAAKSASGTMIAPTARQLPWVHGFRQLSSLILRISNTREKTRVSICQPGSRPGLHYRRKRLIRKAHQRIETFFRLSTKAMIDDESNYLLQCSQG